MNAQLSSSNVEPSQNPRAKTESYISQQLGQMQAGRSMQVKGGGSFMPQGGSPRAEAGMGAMSGMNRANETTQQFGGMNQRLMGLANQAGERRRAEAERARQQAELAAQRKNMQNQIGQFAKQNSTYASNPSGVNYGGGTALARVNKIINQLGGLRVTESLGDRDYDLRHGVARWSGSYHYDASNPAVDVGGSNDQLWAFYNELKRVGGWRQILWQVDGHYDHVHVA